MKKYFMAVGSIMLLGLIIGTWVQNTLPNYGLPVGFGIGIAYSIGYILGYLE